MKKSVKALIFIFSFFISMFVLELFLKISNYQPHQFSREGHLNLIKNNNSSYQFDPHSLYRPTLNSPIYDQDGVRRTQSNHTPDTDGHRILLVGDSFTFGAFVDADKSFPSQLEKILNTEGLNVKTFNGGVLGYGSDQTYYYLTNFLIKKIKPDMIIWNFHSSDLMDNKTAPVFDLNNKKLKKRTILTRYLTLKLLIDSSPLPNFIKKSNIANFFLGNLKSIQTSQEYLENENYRLYSQEKLTQQIDELQIIAKKENAAFYLTLMPTKTLLNDEADEFEALSYLTLSNSLNNYPNFIDFNQQIKKLRTDLKSFSSSDSAELELSSDFLFTNEKEEPNTPDQWRHLNQNGNKLLAKLMAEKLDINVFFD